MFYRDIEQSILGNRTSSLLLNPIDNNAKIEKMLN